MPSDALAGTDGADDPGAPANTPGLEVRQTFEPNRLGAASLAAAYAQIVPIYQRRVRRINRFRVGLGIDGVCDRADEAARSEGGR